MLSEGIGSGVGFYRCGGTVMRDRFNYGVPFGPLGRLADRLFLTAYMRRWLEARNRELKVVAESERWVRYLPRVG